MAEELVNQLREGILSPHPVPVPYNLEPIIMDPNYHRKFMRLHAPTFAGT